MLRLLTVSILFRLTLSGQEASSEPGIAVKYDRFHDLTVVSTDIQLPFELPPSIATPYAYEWLKPTMGAVIGCLGQVKKCAPLAGVHLVFELGTKNWWFDKATIILLADGERIALGPVSWEGQVLGSEMLIERLGADIKTETFIRMANSKSLEGQMNQFEFRLSEEGVASLRNLAAHVELPKPIGAPLSTEHSRPTATPKRSLKQQQPAKSTGI